MRFSNLFKTSPNVSHRFVILSDLRDFIWTDCDLCRVGIAVCSTIMEGENALTDLSQNKSGI